MVRIIFSKTAKTDLKEIVDYIKRDSANYAALEKRKIMSAIDRLAIQPEIGTVLSTISIKYRKMVFGNYLVIYTIISPEQINILSVHHHARSFTNNPAFKDDD
ncbi:type II toxin-antitoxin system RelE/ParE family toxin [Mucilaginibacter defluvii]|uniref:Addiction module RelE/StbE family toxin n=1 Tax=Mucilaginibacter defluvii TaxID=1196019 RepID=A0ABP9GAR2_9SPHI